MSSRDVTESPTLPVFPGAEGFGVETPAGRGGQILRVTSLASRGEGTLRAALATEGPRVIVFEVGGVIDLEGETLRIEHPFVTVAGQSAPSPGVTLIHGDIWILTHDIFIQHLRVRPGDMGKPKASGWEPDGISIMNPSDPDEPGPHHVVVDHCSITWAVDENLSASGRRHEGRERTANRVTFSNCIIAEALDDSSHPKGPHSKGTLIHDHVRDVAVVRNLYACNKDRNPVLKPDASAVVVNNLIYNPGQSALRTLWPLMEYEAHPDTLQPSDLVAVGNVLWHGPDTPSKMPMFQIGAGEARVYMRDNVVQTEAGDLKPTVSTPEPTYLTAPSVWSDDLTVLPTAAVPEHVLTCAGAWAGVRDAIDQRIIDEAVSRTGRIIDSQDEVGGYPQLAPTRHTLTLPDDPHAVVEEGGYTNLEVWLHERAAEVEGY